VVPADFWDLDFLRPQAFFRLNLQHFEHYCLSKTSTPLTYLFFGSNFPLIEFPGRHLNVFVNLCYIFNFHNWCRLNTRAYLRSSIYSLVLNNQVKNNSLLHIILKVTYHFCALRTCPFFLTNHCQHL